MTRQNGRSAANKWMFRIIPAFITGTFIVATYGLVAQICVRYYLQQKHRSGLVAGFLVLYVVFFVLVMASYLRLFIAIQRDPGVVPLLNIPIEEKRAPGQISSLNDSSSAEDASCTIPEACQPRSRGMSQPWVPPDTSPDSPGLEKFYSKDVFVCEADGRPKWCSTCRQWKPDRSHHSSELGRCVRKMDHVCPWVGGMVAERCFNFFTQFTFYAAAYCAVLVGICASTLVLQQNEEEGIDGWVIALLAVSAFFLLFAGGMTLTSFRYVLINITNIDMMRRSQTYHLAVRIPRDAPPDSAYRTIVYPLPDGSQNSDDVPLSIARRDRLAERKFAILETKTRENPWDLGWKGNWKSIMGERVIDWFLPLRHSPCCDHDSRTDSDYAVGKLIDTLRERYGVPRLTEEGEVVVEKSAARDVEMKRVHIST